MFYNVFLFVLETVERVLLGLIEQKIRTEFALVEAIDKRWEKLLTLSHGRNFFNWGEKFVRKNFKFHHTKGV